jgi:hypothetical protein
MDKHIHVQTHSLYCLLHAWVSCGQHMLKISFRKFHFNNFKYECLASFLSCSIMSPARHWFSNCLIQWEKHVRYDHKGVHLFHIIYAEFFRKRRKYITGHEFWHRPLPFWHRRKKWSPEIAVCHHGWIRTRVATVKRGPHEPNWADRCIGNAPDFYFGGVLF